MSVTSSISFGRSTFTIRIAIAATPVTMTATTGVFETGDTDASGRDHGSSRSRAIANTSRTAPA